MNLTPEDAPEELVSVQVDIPVEVSCDQITITDLPADWSKFPAPGELQHIGERWLNTATTVALLVPSALVASEQNVLINPDHSDFPNLVFHAAIPFRYDSRMWK